jgi:hypothetical protein
MPGNELKGKCLPFLTGNNLFRRRGLIVMTQRTLNFLEIYFEAIDENIDEVAGELKDSGIDPEESQNRIMQKIKQKKAEIKIEKGKQFKASVLKIIDKVQNQNKVYEETSEYRIAARKLGTLDKQDEVEIKKNEMILDEISKLIAPK